MEAAKRHRYSLPELFLLAAALVLLAVPRVGNVVERMDLKGDLVTFLFLALLLGITGTALLTGKLRRRPTPFDPPLVTMALFLPVFALVGLANGGRPGLYLADLAPLLFFASYFLFTAIPFRLKYVKRFFIVLALGGALVGVLYLYAEATFIAGRVMTRQANMAAVGMLLAVNYLCFLADNTWKRAVGVVVLLLCTFAVILSFQRAIWLAVPVVLLLNLFLAHRRGYLKRGALPLLTAVGVLLLAAGAIIRAYPDLVSVGMALGSRAESLQGGTQEGSLMIRLVDYGNAFGEFAESPLLGKGAGTELFQELGHRKVVFVDSGFFTALWKFGLVGGIAFVWVYGLALFYSFSASIRAREPTTLFAALGCLTFLAVVSISGLAGVLSLLYRFNIFTGAVLVWSYYLYRMTRPGGQSASSQG